MSQKVSCLRFRRGSKLMLTIRPFRNEDSPKLLEIWQKNRHGPEQSRFSPLSMERLDVGPLAMPFFDRRGIQLALDGDRPVGFAQVGFGPNPGGDGLSCNIGHIPMVAVVPEFPDPVVVCEELIKAGEAVLIDSGVREIYGGSPRPSLPFYLGLYGGAEPIGVFDADAAVIEAFRRLGYGVCQKTARFQRVLTDYSPPFIPSMLQWKSKLRLEVNDRPKAKNWWDALSLTHFDWIESTAFLEENNLPVSQIRIRMAEPEPERSHFLYDKNWDAALMDIRVRPDFYRQGVGTYVLAETLRYVIAMNHVARIEAHIAEDCSNLYGLLKSLHWNEVETGTIFSKKIA